MGGLTVVVGFEQSDGKCDEEESWRVVVVIVMVFFSVGGDFESDVGLFEG